MMVIYFLFLLMGYIVFMFLFVFGVVVFIIGKFDVQWVKDIWKWIIVSWIFLIIGLIFGGVWVYEELGWGGFWMWDPVENAGFIFWFIVIVFLYFIII